MLIKLQPKHDLTRVSQLLTTDPHETLRLLDLRIQAMTGNAQIIPISKKSRCTVQSWPVPPQPAA